MSLIVSIGRKLLCTSSVPKVTSNQDHSIGHNLANDSFISISRIGPYLYEHLGHGDRS